jgi:hypothetical protein
MMDAMSPDLVTTIVSTSAFSALLTLAIAGGLDLRRRRRQATGYLLGVQLEIAYAQECAGAYVTDVDAGRQVWAPNYRIVTDFARRGVTWLKTEGYLSHEESNQIFWFSTRATEINRSLDALGTLTCVEGYSLPEHPIGKTAAETETKRAYAKCENLLGKIQLQAVGSAPEASRATTDALARIKKWRVWTH